MASPWAVGSFGVMPAWSHGRPRTGSTSGSVPPCAATRTGVLVPRRCAFGGAEHLIALYEGLQLQALLRAELDLVAAFDRAVARFERGWMDRYEPQAARRLAMWDDDGSGSWEL